MNGIKRNGQKAKIPPSVWLYWSNKKRLKTRWTCRNGNNFTENVVYIHEEHTGRYGAFIYFICMITQHIQFLIVVSFFHRFSCNITTSAGLLILATCDNYLIICIICALTKMIVENINTVIEWFLNVSFPLVSINLSCNILIFSIAS